MVHDITRTYNTKTNDSCNNHDIQYGLTVHDISYYVLKNEITKKSEKRLKSIINNISDMLVILKQSNDFICFENANDNFLKVFDVDI